MDEINEIVQILEEVNLENSRKGTLILCNRLRKINRQKWNDYYEELIIELGKNDKIIRDVDFQMLWFECLGFPTALMPLLRDNRGNTLGCYGSLESDFNKISGFHDGNLNYMTYEDNNLILFIDLHGKWGAINRDEYDYILNFREVFAIYYGDQDNQSYKLSEDKGIDVLMGKPIVSITELPAIRYILNGFNLEYDFDLIKYRLFCIDLGMSNIYGIDHIIVFAKKWNLKHV